MPLLKTSVQLDPVVLENLKARYPDLSVADIIRLCMVFVDTIGPELIRDGRRLSIPSSLHREEQV